MREWIKRLLICLCLCLPAIPAQAEGDRITADYTGKGDLQKGQYEATARMETKGKSRAADTLGLENAYATAVLNRWTTLDVSEFGICVEEANEILSQVRNAFPQFFYADITMYSYSTVDRMVYDITLEYTAGEPQIAAYEAAVAEALAQIDEGMPDEYKALILHDYLAANCAYDMENLEANTLPDTAFQSYGVLVLKSAVCQGYALAYQDLLDRVGIPCITVGSDAMDHAWNIVELEGEYYHVDVTWDDPTWDMPGQVLHDYFLLSDESISEYEGEPDHYGWESPVSADSDRYEDGFWIDSMAGIYGKDGFLYYLDMDGYLKKHSIDTGEEAVLGTVEENWPTPDGSGWYSMCFSRLLMLNGKLFYTTPEEICSVELDGSGNQILERPVRETGYLYGLALNGEQLDYVLKESPNSQDSGVRGTAKNFTFLVSGMVLGQETLILREGKQEGLFVLTLPNYRVGRGLIWSSSNEAVASVDSQGMVTAKMGGEAVITVSDPTGSFSSSCGVQVTHSGYESLVEREANCTQKGSIVYRCQECHGLLYQEEIPTNGQHRFGEWKVSIQATIFSSGKEVRTCQLCGVQEARSIAKKKAKVTLNAKSAPLQAGTSTTAIQIKSCSKGDKISSFHSSNPKVATVNKKSGKITGKKTGTATITLTMKSGAKAKCKIKVQKGRVATTKLNLNKKKVTLKKGKTFALTATRTPITAKDKITYRSSNSKVVRVSKKGTLKALKKGKAEITVKTVNKKQAVCKVTVK